MKSGIAKQRARLGLTSTSTLLALSCSLLANFGCSDNDTTNNNNGAGGASNGGATGNTGGKTSASTGGSQARTGGAAATGGAMGTTGGAAATGGATGATGGAATTGGATGVGGTSAVGGGTSKATGGAGTATGGSSTIGGTTGGATTVGGTKATGGAGTTGGATTVGGTKATGGTTTIGGAGTTGGATTVGGTKATGGTTTIGGAGTTGGATAVGGTKATGGATATGGVGTTGGATSTGGVGTTGGATSTGGVGTTGGATSTGTGGAGGEVSTALRNIQVNMTGMTLNQGQLMMFRLVNAANQLKFVGVLDSLPSTSTSYDFAMPNSALSELYRLDFFADVNGNRTYDAPPTDNAWSLSVPAGQADVALPFARSTTFTDISLPAFTAPGASFTLQTTGMTPHVGQLLEVRVILPSSGQVIGRYVLTSVPGDAFSVTIPLIIADLSSYQVDFFADMNGNGQYDAPPADHAWRIAGVGSPSGLTVPFTHNTNFTDVGF